MKKKQAVIACTDVPASRCPNCHAQLEAVTGATLGSRERPTPEAGSATVCGYCGELLVFDSHLQVRRPTPELAARLRRHIPLLAELQRWVREGKMR